MDSKVYPMIVKDEGLTVVYDPGDDTEFDLILVHDFVDGAQRTWTSQNFFWPSDFLPKEVPKVRIMVYGYPTKRSLSILPQQGTDLLTCVQEERKQSKTKGRPVVFLCHGLGGLIVKNAIILSGKAKTSQRFLANCTRGVVFLGTPHRGSKASLQARITRIVKHFSAEQRATLPNARSGLWDQLNTFPHIMDKFQIPVECFYEATNSQVVEEASATMGRGERTHALSTTHLEMCRFTDPTDPSLLCIVACIKRLCTNPKDVIKPDEKYAIPVKPPFSRNVHFCGRENILDQIQKTFWPDILTADHSLPLRRASIALHGFGGNGKTQILLEYMHRYHTYKLQYSSIFWLNGNTTSKLKASAHSAVESIINHYDMIWRLATDRNQRIAHSLKIFEPPITTRTALLKAINKSSSVRILRDWLSHESNNRWLVIIDNYDPDAFNLDMVLPVTETGHVMTSTRKPFVCPDFCVIQVPEAIGETESVDLLIRSSGKDPGKISRNDMIWASTIVKLVGQLPLALDQVGAYISSEKISIQKYSKLLKSEPGRPLKDQPSKIPLTSIWEMSFNKLSDNAKDLLELCSLICNEDIPIKLLQGGSQDVEWMRDDATIMAALGCLISFSFVEGRPDDTCFSIQPFVHSWVRGRLEHDEEALIRTRKLVTYMVTSSFTSPDAMAASECSYERHIFPHIEKCAEIFETHLYVQGECMNDRTREVAYNLARAYEYLSDPQKAGSLYERALKGIEKDSRSVQDVKVMDAFGVNLALQGRQEAALVWYTTALEGAERTVGPKNSLTLNIIQHMAMLYAEQGNYDKAAEEYTRVLEIQEKKYAKIHPATLETMDRLALVYISQGKHDDALELLQKVRDVREKSPSLGTSHPSTLDTLKSIAKVLEKQGKYREALEAHKVMLGRKVEFLGENHHSTLDTMDGIASVYERQGMYKEALDWYGKLLEGLSKLFGTVKHPWVFCTFSEIADIYVQLGQYNDAEKEYKKSHTGFKVLGMEVHEHQTAISIAQVLLSKGQHVEALAWSQAAHKGLEEQPGPDHHPVITSTLCLANVLEFQGHYPKALKLYQQALASSTLHSGPHHPTTLATITSIANIYTKQSLFKKASQLYTQTHLLQEQSLGADHPQTLTTLLGLATLHTETGSYDHSFQLHQSLVDTLTLQLGATHPRTLIASCGLATALQNKSHPAPTSALYNAAISTLDTIYPSHPALLAAHLGIANAHLAAQRFDQAYTLYTRTLAAATLPPRHPVLLAGECARAFAALKLKRLDEAGTLYSAALKAAEETLGMEHVVTLAAVHGAAAVMGKRKKFGEAARGFARAAQGREKVLGRAHADTERSVKELAKVKRKKKSWGWFF